MTEVAVSNAPIKQAVAIEKPKNSPREIPPLKGIKTPPNAPQKEVAPTERSLAESVSSPARNSKRSTPISLMSVMVEVKDASVVEPEAARRIY